MRNVLIKIIECYQKIPFSSHMKCRYYPTCSNYAKVAIERFGALKGSFLMIKRILKCNPFSRGGIDLVPEDKKDC